MNVNLPNPEERPTFVVRMVGAPGSGKTSLTQALLEMPVATDEELARLSFVEEAGAKADAVVLCTRADPTPEELEAAKSAGPLLFVAVHARDLAHDADADEVARKAWGEVTDPQRVYLTATPEGGTVRGVDELRAALLEAALSSVDLPIDRVRRAKRPYALSVIAGAAMVTAAEGLLPGAAAFVVATQAGAISSLHYLYTGRWMGRSQALALMPAFIAQAAGGSIFLLVKSFLPPTGVADVLAAGVAASMTVSVLGTIAWALDQGYSLEEKKKLQVAFKKMQARTKAQRKAVTANKHRWGEKEFWVDLARRVVFDP
jgi:hypothetical protein